METPTVLITDAQSRQGLAAARSLGKAGIRVLAADVERMTLTGCSRYVEQSYTLPPPATQEAAFMSALQEVVAKERPDMVLPMTDRSLVAIARHAHRLRESTILPFPDIDTIMLARDKARTIAAAAAIGVPVPRTICIDSIDDVRKVAAFPVLMKPVQGSGSRGVRIVESSAELRAAAEITLDSFGSFLVQDVIPREGEEVGCYVLCGPDGGVVTHMLQRRLRSYPVGGGPSTLRETLHDDQILDLSLELLGGLGWRGPAMVEWKRDPRDGVPKLMEVNPRFWGSLEGSIAAGVDFPLLTFRTFTQQEVVASSDYEDGLRSHWVFPGDTLWLLSSGWSFRNVGAFIRSCVQHDDVWSWSDPLPFFGSLVIAVKHASNPDRRRYFLRRSA